MGDDERQGQESPGLRLACELRLDTAKSTEAVEEHEEAFLRLMEKLAVVAERYATVLPAEDRGDGVRAFFDDPRATVECAFELRREFRRLEWEQAGLPPLLPRIALHAAPYRWRATGKIAGASTVATARLEPIVAPGEIWATEQFASMFLSLRFPYVELEYLGTRSYAKDYGEHPTYRVREATGAPAAHPPGTSVRSVSLGLLRSGTHEQRLAAADALGAVRGQDVRTALERVGGDERESFDLRRMALLSLEEHQSPQSIGSLQRIIATSEYASMRAVAVQVLGAIGDVGAIATLVDLAEQGIEASPEDDVVIALGESALMALRQFGTQRARLTVLRALRRDEPGWLKAACVAASHQYPDAEIATLLAGHAVARTNPVDLRATALEALISVQRDAQPASDAQGAAIVDLLDMSENIELRGLAIVYLAGAATARAQQRLLELSEQSEDPLSGMAITAAAHIDDTLRLPVPDQAGDTRDLYERIDNELAARTERKHPARRTLGGGVERRRR